MPLTPANVFNTMRPYCLWRRFTLQEQLRHRLWAAPALEPSLSLGRELALTGSSCRPGTGLEPGQQKSSSSTGRAWHAGASGLPGGSTCTALPCITRQQLFKGRVLTCMRTSAIRCSQAGPCVLLTHTCVGQNWQSISEALASSATYMLSYPPSSPWNAFRCTLKANKQTNKVLIC